MNVADLLKELKRGKYGNAINYGTSILNNDYAQGNHFRNEGRRRFLDRIRPI